MKCDVNAEHGEMQIEPMYGLNGVIDQYGWFCQHPGCDGYGGPVERKAKPVIRKSNDGQLSMFSKDEG